MSDLISRQEAIEAMSESLKRVFPEHRQIAEKCLNVLPSAQPEPCEDAVSRDSVKFLLCKETCHPGAFCPDGFCREICEKVDALPSATPKQRMGEWIPVSERLPEVGKDVMVCYDFKGHRSVLIGVLYGDEKFHGYDDEYLTPEGRKYRKAVAWMPLPDPYRAERKTDEKKNI